MAQSYANSGGTGDRTGSITITTTAALGGGTINNLIDGAFALNTTDSMFFTNGQSSKEIKFDFGSGRIIDEAFWYQDVVSSHGTWKWQGSTNDSSYTDIGGTFTLGGYAGIQRHVTLHGNTTSYRYYKLLQTAGTTSSGSWNKEIEFRIDGTPAGATDYSNSGGYGDRTASITVTTTATTNAGALNNLVDGAFNEDATDAWQWSSGQSTREVKFDFGINRVIDEASWQQNTASSHGTWKWQGSTNDSSYTDIGSTFTLGGTGGVSFLTTLHGNTTSYRYYKLLQTASTTASTFNVEIEFRIDVGADTGTLAATETNDAAAFTGSVAWNAALTATETGDTAAFTGAIIDTGTLAATETNDDCAFAGGVGTAGTLVATEANDTASLPGTISLSLLLSATEDNDDSALIGTIAWNATLATTDANDTGAFTGQVTAQPTGTLAATEQNDTYAGVGYRATTIVLDVIEVSDAAAFNGQGLPITGTLAATEANDILVFSQPDVYSVAMAAIENADTAALVGTLKRHPNVVVIVCNN